MRNAAAHIYPATVIISQHCELVAAVISEYIKLNQNHFNTILAKSAVYMPPKVDRFNKMFQFNLN